MAPSTGKPMAQFRAELQASADIVQTITLCLHCPDWTHSGTALEGREASLQHRRVEHPETLIRKPRRGHKGMRKRALRSAREEEQVSLDAAEANRARSEREQAEMLAKIERGRLRDEQARAALDEAAA
jgi:uncharacterized protein YaiL (DUF2058 family)